MTAQKLGLIRSIGVSNFEPEHLDAIIEATGVTPALNQIEIHPYWVQERMVAENKKRGIVTEAWSPLGRGSDALNLAIFDFELTEDEINQINQLNKEDGRIDGQDPNEYEEFE